MVALLPTALLLSQLPVKAQKEKKSGNADPLIGHWSLDSTKSTFTPGPAPAGRTLTFEATDNGFRQITKDSGGFLNDQAEYTVSFDGKDYPNDPAAAVDTYAVKRVDANTIERTGKNRGMTVETSTFKISANGKVLTITLQGSIRGQDYSSTQVYDKL
jgi:hypothetical protein